MPILSVSMIWLQQSRRGTIDFDVCIATPDAMKVVGQLGQILGPRGLMPNPKVGTVSMDVTTAVKNAKAGQVQYRTDKAGIVMCTIGRASFSVDQLQQNIVCPDRCTQQGQAVGGKGTVSEESLAVFDHGCGCSRRSG